MSGEVDEKTGRHSIVSILAGLIAAKAISEIGVSGTARALKLYWLPEWSKRVLSLAATYGAARYTHSGVSEGLLLACIGGVATDAIRALPALGAPDSVTGPTAWRYFVAPEQLFTGNPDLMAHPVGRNTGSPE